MVQWLRGHASEPKDHEFESHRCHLMQAYGRRYVQVRPVRPQISHFKNKNKKFNISVTGLHLPIYKMMDMFYIKQCNHCFVAIKQLTLDVIS